MIVTIVCCSFNREKINGGWPQNKKKVTMGPDNKLGQYQYDSHLIIIELTMREELMFEYLSLSIFSELW